MTDTRRREKKKHSTQGWPSHVTSMEECRLQKHAFFEIFNYNAGLIRHDSQS